MIELPVKTTCPYCGVGCGILALTREDGQVEIQGDPDHPANYGRLCSKGVTLAETVGLQGRLLHPEIHGKRATWDQALDYVAQGFLRVMREHGPEAVAFYVSGQLLTEDYYVANKLMKGFIGSANIDTNSRLCMASSVAGHKRAFGSDTVPGCYEDLELAELIVLVGSNTAWCHPVLFQRLVAAKKNNPARKIVVIDPRRTVTCEIADLHLALRPGSDAALFNGLLYYLSCYGGVNADFLEAHTEGYADALRAARISSPSIPAVAKYCGVSTDKVALFFQLFTRTDKTLTVYSQGINQSSSGTDKVNAIINCHLATGRIGRPGMGPFSVTGQPNAMGGREVGGLANQLAAHMELDNPEHRERVRRFWHAPRIASRPGLKAVDLFRAVEAGRIKALWIMATNPAVSLPDADRAGAALKRCGLVVVSDCMRNTDTTRFANVLLPALTWGEKEGTVTNSERRISRQRTFLPKPGVAQPDWWIITQVAQRMGFAAEFTYESAATIFREHAALSGFDAAKKQGDQRAFNISGLAELSDIAYEALAPIQWPVAAAAPAGTSRLFTDGRFFTVSGKARLIPIAPRRPANPTDAGYPLVLNTGRVRDHWHTMTRTGKSPRLAMHDLEPYAELHPDDAATIGAQEQALVRVISRFGDMIARAHVTSDQQRGSVFVPMHWNDQFAHRAKVDALVSPVTDPISGQPESKHTPVRVELYQPAWYGFALARRPLVLNDIDYWVSAGGSDFLRYALAGERVPRDWAVWARDLLSASEQGEWLDYLDNRGGRYRAVHIIDNRLDACVFIAPTFALPPRAWLAALFGKELTSSERMSLLAGRPGHSQPDTGAIVCACFAVGQHTLATAIRQNHLRSTEEMGVLLKAGTNCGSCLPELKALLAECVDDWVQV
ncbi:MAG TPA: molybdopterin-dependent oxidoreductase [Acidiferrobacterales bacterium]|nr:molybdopterin-dependent oxidoreductase [Acidiferrobacterales bacterium]